MEQNLCSREFQDFYNQLQNHSISTEELLQEMRKCISPITEKVSVGNLTVVLTNPSSILDLHGGVQTFALYENARGWDNTPYEKEFHATDGGKVAFAFFPCKGVQWTENDLRTLQFLAQNFYVLLGRSRMIEMMQRLTVYRGIFEYQEFQLHQSDCRRTKRRCDSSAVCVCNPRFSG